VPINTAYHNFHSQDQGDQFLPAMFSSSG